MPFCSSDYYRVCIGWKPKSESTLLKSWVALFSLSYNYPLRNLSDSLSIILLFKQIWAVLHCSEVSPPDCGASRPGDQNKKHPHVGLSYVDKQNWGSRDLGNGDGGSYSWYVACDCRDNGRNIISTKLKILPNLLAKNNKYSITVCYVVCNFWSLQQSIRSPGTICNLIIKLYQVNLFHYMSSAHISLLTVVSATSCFT